MTLLRSDPGLTLHIPTPPLGAPQPEVVETEESGIRAPAGQDLRITPLAEEGERVAKGAPVACLRDAPDVQFVAPLAGRIARIALQPGRKLSEIALFREPGGDQVRHDVPAPDDAARIRLLMQRAGLWPLLRRRPFGGMPEVSEVPAAIVVMAVDTRPLAPDPRLALAGRETAFARGLDALARLTEGPVLVCAGDGPPLAGTSGRRGAGPGGRIRAIRCGARHPQGSAGFCIHRHVPARPEAPVWDIHAEDTAALGALLETGVLPMTRLVSIAGPALRAARLVQTLPGADLRGLTRRLLKPGPHRLLSGSAIDGHRAHWLAPRDRLVTALPPAPARRPAHWLVAALTRSAGPRPVIPTAALTQAFGAALPVAAFIRALSAGDEETAMKLGLLSLLEEDLALADYVLGGEAGLTGMLRSLLDRIRREYAA